MDLFGGRFGNSLRVKFSIARLDQIVRYNQLFWQAGLLFSVFARSRTQITPEPLWQQNLSLSFTVGAIDDSGKNTTFCKINPFSSERATLDKYRTIITGFLPRKLTATSARYDFYERLRTRIYRIEFSIKTCSYLNSFGSLKRVAA